MPHPSFQPPFWLEQGSAPAGKGRKWGKQYQTAERACHHGEYDQPAQILDGRKPGEGKDDKSQYVGGYIKKNRLACREHGAPGGLVKTMPLSPLFPQPIEKVNGEIHPDPHRDRGDDGGGHVQTDIAKTHHPEATERGEDEWNDAQESV